MNLSQRSLSSASVFLLVLSSLFPIVLSYTHPTYLTDDSYITLTFAKNLAEGNGFVYNHPPAIQGTTTPFMAMLVAAVAMIFPFISIPVIASILSALFWVGTGWLLLTFRHVWNLSVWQAALAGSNLIIASTWPSALGMEVYLFGFILILAISLYYSERYWATGFALGLLFLTRGEGILLGGILGLMVIVRNTKQFPAFRLDSFLRTSLQLICGFAIPVGLWFLYAASAFGALLPNTLAAKQAQGDAGIMAGLFIVRLIYEWLPNWGQAFRLKSIPMFNVWWFFVGIGILISAFRAQKWLVFVFWIGVYTAGYTLLNVTGYWWYQYPILHIFNLFFALGIIYSVENISVRVSSKAFRSVAISVVLAVNIAQLTNIVTYTVQHHTGDSRAESYIGLGKWFHENAEASDSVSFIEVGYLGYYTPNRIIDLAGLVTPEIVPHVAKGDFGWGFWHYQPDHFVYLPDFDWALKTIRSDARFQQCYSPVAQLPGPREAELTIYTNSCAGNLGGN